MSKPVRLTYRRRIRHTKSGDGHPTPSSHVKLKTKDFGSSIFLIGLPTGVSVSWLVWLVSFSSYPRKKQGRLKEDVYVWTPGRRFVSSDTTPKVVGGEHVTETRTTEGRGNDEWMWIVTLWNRTPGMSDDERGSGVDFLSQTVPSLV